MDTRSEQTFFGISALLFIASAAVTVVWCAHMSAMGEMPMAGGMSMTWSPGPRAALSFLCMWIAMMTAMMLPSLVFMLRHYRLAIAGGTNLGALSAVVGGAYFIVWAALGTAVYPLGVMIDALKMELPFLSGGMAIIAAAVVLVAGALQFTAWKSCRLACCRAAPGCALQADAATATIYGLRLGVHCITCCANLTAILLVVGIMDLRAMVLVTAAITTERLWGERAARIIGAATVAAGLFMMAQAISA